MGLLFALDSSEHADPSLLRGGREGLGNHSAAGGSKFCVTIREISRPAGRYNLKMSRLLTPAQAAEFLAVTPKHLLELTNEGALRWVNIGLEGRRPTRRYKQDDLAEVIEKRSQKACRYTENTANQNIPMTSNFAVVDFSVPRARATGARRSGFLNRSERKFAPS